MDNKTYRTIRSIAGSLSDISDELRKMNQTKPLIADGNEKIEVTVKRWIDQGLVRVINKEEE